MFSIDKAQFTVKKNERKTPLGVGIVGAPFRCKGKN